MDWKFLLSTKKSSFSYNPLFGDKNPLKAPFLVMIDKIAYYSSRNCEKIMIVYTSLEAFWWELGFLYKCNLSSCATIFCVGENSPKLAKNIFFVKESPIFALFKWNLVNGEENYLLLIYKVCKVKQTLISWIIPIVIAWKKQRAMELQIISRFMLSHE